MGSWISHIWSYMCKQYKLCSLKNAHYHYLYPYQKYRFIPNKKGQLLCTSCTSLKKKQQKNRIHLFLAPHILKKMFDSKDPNCTSLCWNVQKMDLVCFVKPAFDQIWPTKTKGWTNKHYFKANNHHNAKKLGVVSATTLQQSFHLEGDFIANPVPHRAPLLDSSVQQGSSRSSREVLDSEEGWPRLWAAAMLPDQPSHHCVHSSPLATKVSSIVMVDHYLSFLMIPSYQLWVF